MASSRAGCASSKRGAIALLACALWLPRPARAVHEVKVIAELNEAWHSQGGFLTGVTGIVAKLQSSGKALSKSFQFDFVKASYQIKRRVFEADLGSVDTDQLGTETLSIQQSFVHSQYDMAREFEPCPGPLIQKSLAVAGRALT